MDARELVQSLVPGAAIRELAAGANRVFRVFESDERTSVIKIYGAPSRQRREQHALEALSAAEGAPRILSTGSVEGVAWTRMTDGGHWNLSDLPKNLTVYKAAGSMLRGIHTAPADLTNLSARIDSDYVSSHYRSTIERLGRYRRRFGMEQKVLESALKMQPPLASAPATSHTKPLLSKFIVNESGDVTLVDWEWATPAPPEWDLSLVVWRLSKRIGEDASAAFRDGYGAELPESHYRPWVAYHAAMMMLEAAEVREGRLGDLGYLVGDLTEAVLGT